MSEYALNDGIDDDEFGEEIGYTTFTGREGTIYLIDAAKFPNSPEKSITENEDDFRLCLELIEADLLKNILINPNDLVSVVFYNTEHSPPPRAPLSTEDDDIATALGRDNCAIFIPLSPLSKELIQYFKSFRESDDFFDFKAKFGCSVESHLKDALWLCSRLIIRCSYKLIQSKILLFTNNELPYMPQTVEQHQTIVQAQDMFDNNISVDVVPILDEFDYEPFYKEYLCVISGLELVQFQPPRPIEQKQSLMSRSYCANYRKSCLRHLNFELSQGVAMSCDVYSFSRSAKKPNSVKMFRQDTSKLVAGKRSVYVLAQEEAMDVDEQNPDGEITQRNIPLAQQFKSQNICGREIIFKPGELVRLKSLQDPGLRLLGFKPITQLRPRWMIKHCLFLYPNEKRANGSTTLFRALWEKCLEKEKFALCTLATRRNLPPKYVALVPQTDENQGNDGFCIIHLPMETSVSVLDSVVNPLPEPTLEQVNLFKDLCKKLRFKYQPEQFANPMLQSFYNQLEGLVYDEEVKPVEDLTLPDLERLDKKIDPFINRIDEEFGTEVIGGTKRANNATGASQAKIPKKDLSMEDIANALRNDRAEAVTLAHLRDFIKSKHAHAPSGTKKVIFEFAQKLID